MFVEEMLESGRTTLVTIGGEQPLIEAAGQLGAGTDILAVVGPTGTLLGIVTKTDVVRQMAVCDGTGCRCAVSTVMTTAVTRCIASDPLQDVADRMKRHHLKNIPVIDSEGRPIGMLTARSGAFCWVTPSMRKRCSSTTSKASVTDDVRPRSAFSEGYHDARHRPESDRGRAAVPRLVPLG